MSVLNELKKGPLRVGIIGCGNWGSAIGKVVAENSMTSYLFHEEVKMWVRDEEVVTTDKGVVKLSEVMNTTHENVSFLPGIVLPKNLVAVNDFKEIAKVSDLIVFVMPHQFLKSTCRAMKPHVKSTAQAITLVKGLEVENGNPVVFSELIQKELGLPSCALSGANVAKGVAKMEFAETTIGYGKGMKDIACIWQQLFDRPYFKTQNTPDIIGVQICGALKNVVALAVGFADGLGAETNAKAAVMRIGVNEIIKFVKVFYKSTSLDVYFESAGYADVITTCFGGRNVRCASEFVKRGGSEGGVKWDDVEKCILGNQKMQGQLTCAELHEVLSFHGVLKDFPLFAICYKISFEGLPAKEMLKTFKTDSVLY